MKTDARGNPVDDITPTQRHELKVQAAIDDANTTCTRCDAAIFWATTAKGKRIPLDVTSTERGKRFKIQLSVGTLVAYFRFNALDGPGFSCHWDSCKPGDGA